MNLNSRISDNFRKKSKKIPFCNSVALTRNSLIIRRLPLLQLGCIRDRQFLENCFYPPNINCETFQSVEEIVVKVFRGV